MLDIVKFKWRNANGYWIPVAWVLVTSDSDLEAVRAAARVGRPSMTDLVVLDRDTIPEDLRLTGMSQRLLSMVILHDRKADSYDVAEMLAAMLVVTT